jgi:hypothetical protein
LTFPSAQNASGETYWVRYVELTHPLGLWTWTQSAPSTTDDDPARITLVAVAANDPTTEYPAPGPDRTLSTSVGATRMTAYGPDGMPGMIPPGGETLLVGTIGAPGVMVGTAMVAVAVGSGGVEVGMAAGVSVGNGTAVGQGVGVPNRERVQEASRNVKTMLNTAGIIFFMVRSF